MSTNLTHEESALLHMVLIPRVASLAIRAEQNKVVIFNELKEPHCLHIWNAYKIAADRFRTWEVTKRTLIQIVIEYVSDRWSTMMPEYQVRTNLFLNTLANVSRASLVKEEGEGYLKAIISQELTRQVQLLFRANPTLDQMKEATKQISEKGQKLLQDDLTMSNSGLDFPFKSVRQYLGTVEKIPFGIDFIDDCTYGGMEPGTSTGIVGPSGGGKCLAVNTPVLLYDGSIKKVQEIVVGDLLMGPDSTPRRVLQLGRGRSTMYKIIPAKGEPFTVNDEHILTVAPSSKQGVSYKGRRYCKGDYIDIPVKEYLKSGKNFKSKTKLVRVAVNFPERPDPELDPYFVGVYLGDGAVLERSLRKNDQDRLEEQAGCKHLLFPMGSGGVSVAPVKQGNTQQSGERRILDPYKLGSREVRLAVLAGLMDTAGYMHHGHCKIETEFDGLTEDILFLCRSLGFAAYDNYCGDAGTNVGSESMCHRITISGDLSCVPVKLECWDRAQWEKVKDVLHTGFTVQEMPEDDYYGFVIDGDHRFVLGDFTVTHNTMLTTRMVYTQAVLRNTTLWLTYEQSMKGDIGERFASAATGVALPAIRQKTLDELGEEAVLMMEEAEKAFGEYLIVRDFSKEAVGPDGTPLPEEYQRAGSAKDICELCDLLEKSGRKVKFLVLDWLGEMVTILASREGRDIEKDFRSIAMRELKDLRTYCKTNGIVLVVFHQLRADLVGAPPVRKPHTNEAMYWGGFATNQDMSFALGTMRASRVCWFIPGKSRTGVPRHHKIRLDGDHVRFVMADNYIQGPSGDFVDPDEEPDDFIDKDPVVEQTVSNDLVGAYNPELGV